MINRVMNLIKNLKYLSKFNLRKDPIVKRSDIDSMLVDLIDNMMYLNDSDLIRPNILDPEKTLDLLCNSNKSIARFCDGELELASGGNIPFQTYNKLLADRIKSILQSSNENLLVGIDYCYFYRNWNRNMNAVDRAFFLHAVPKYRNLLLSLLNESTCYCNASFGSYGKKTKEKDQIWNKVRTIWEGKKLLLVGCKEAADNIQYDVFDNAKERTWLYIPNRNAFAVYDKILKKCQDYPKDTLIILMAGPTAGVWAYDLSNIGYRALDLGHIAKAYDWYRRNIEITAKNEIDFFGIDK